jgi:geranyl diphosphate synthase
MVFMMQGIITAPILYAMEEFPQLHEVVDSGFEDPANVDLVSNCICYRTSSSLSFFIYL